MEFWEETFLNGVEFYFFYIFLIEFNFTKCSLTWFWILRTFGGKFQRSFRTVCVTKHWPYIYTYSVTILFETKDDKSYDDVFVRIHIQEEKKVFYDRSEGTFLPLSQSGDYSSVGKWLLIGPWNVCRLMKFNCLAIKPASYLRLADTKSFPASSREQRLIVGSR